MPPDASARQRLADDVRGAVLNAHHGSASVDEVVDQILCAVDPHLEDLLRELDDAKDRLTDLQSGAALNAADTDPVDDMDVPLDLADHERELSVDFYVCPNMGEWVYKWRDERRVLAPVDTDLPTSEDHRLCGCGERAFSRIGVNASIVDGVVHRPGDQCFPVPPPPDRPYVIDLNNESVPEGWTVIDTWDSVTGSWALIDHDETVCTAEEFRAEVDKAITDPPPGVGRITHTDGETWPDGTVRLPDPIGSWLDGHFECEKGDDAADVEMMTAARNATAVALWSLIYRKGDEATDNEAIRALLDLLVSPPDEPRTEPAAALDACTLCGKPTPRSEQMGVCDECYGEPRTEPAEMSAPTRRNIFGQAIGPCPASPADDTEGER